MNWKRRWICVVFLLFLQIVAVPAQPAAAQGQAVLLRGFWMFLATFARDYTLDKAVDYYLLEAIQEQLGEYLPFLQAECEKAPLADHQRLVKQVMEAKKLLDICGKLASKAYTRAEARNLEAALRNFAGDLTLLERRTSNLEYRSDELENRMDSVERRLDEAERVRQRDCRDMSGPAAASVGNYLVLLSEDSILRSSEDLDGLRTRATIYLNACSEDRTRRGILAVLQTVTRDLDRPVEAVATFRDLQGRSFNGQRSGSLFQRRVSLFRPGPGTEGHITELFLPHDDLPTATGNPALGFAITLFHDGDLLFAAQRGLRCWSGDPIRCSWI